MAHASDSGAQSDAEPLILAAVAEQLGVTLAPQRLTLPGGASADVDGVAPNESVLVEVFARQGTQYPPATAVQRTCGSLRAAYQQLGWTASWTAVADAQIVGALRVYSQRYGDAPTVTAWRQERRRPSAAVIIRRYGTWSAALAAASE